MRPLFCWSIMRLLLAGRRRTTVAAAAPCVSSAPATYRAGLSGRLAEGPSHFKQKRNDAFYFDACVGGALAARRRFGPLPVPARRGRLAGRDDFGGACGSPSTAGASADHSLMTA